MHAPSAGSRTDDAIQAEGGTATLVPLDITDLDGIARLGAALNERHGKLDVLVGNAAVLGPVSPLGHIDMKSWTDTMTVNASANFQLVRCMEPLLKLSDAPRVVFVSSGAAAKATAYAGPYAASKAALEALGPGGQRNRQHGAARHRYPGPIRTRMRAILMPGEDPLTLDTPDQVAEFIVPLCLPSWTETGRIYDYTTRKALSFQPPS